MPPHCPRRAALWCSNAEPVMRAVRLQRQCRENHLAVPTDTRGRDARRACFGGGCADRLRAARESVTDTRHPVPGVRGGAQQDMLRELSRALFVRGCRYGWFARDMAAEIRPYDAPPPPEVDDNWRNAHLSLKAAVAADEQGPRGRRERQRRQRRRQELQQRETYLRETLPELQRKWDRDRRGWEDAEQRRVYSQPQHVPKGPGQAPRRSDIVGGDHFGWQCLLTTLGSSLLAGGTRLEILDLTERGTAALLTELCQITGYVDTDVVLLPEQAPTIDLFAGMEAAGIASMVVESLGAATGDRSQRLLDRRILDAAIRSLKPPITPARLTAALRLFLRGARTPEVAALIDDEEFDRLDAAFAEEQRTALLERLTVLEATLEPLAHFGTSMAARRPLLADGSAGGVRCAALSGSDVEVVNELLVDLLVQSFIRRVTMHAQSCSGDGHSSSEPVIPDRVAEMGSATRARGLGEMCAIVLGAERIVPSHLDKLNSLSLTHGFGLVLFFAALTEDIAERAVQNSDALGIMRLTNHSQADRAASLIGSEYRMVFTSDALSENRSQTVNWGWSSGQSSSAMMPFNVTTTEGENFGESQQEGTGTQRTYSRVHELVVEPETIQRLGSTAIEFVDLVSGANRDPISLDVHPLRALGP